MPLPRFDRRVARLVCGRALEQERVGLTLISGHDDGRLLGSDKCHGTQLVATVEDCQAQILTIPFVRCQSKSAVDDDAMGKKCHFFRAQAQQGG